MNEESLKQIIRKILESRGFKVNLIEEIGKKPTPDFEILRKSDKYTVELKIKEDDDEKRSKEVEKLLKGNIVGKVESIGPRNKLSGIVKKGEKQIKEHDPCGDTFRVIWLHSAGHQFQLQNERFKNTLYGTETLISLRKPGVFHCYYFHESSFYSLRNSLDCAILTYISGEQITMQICINTLSPRVDLFRKSDLITIFSDALCDPDTLAKSDEYVMIADCPLNRKNVNDIVMYLQRKYNLDHLQTIPMNYISTEGWVPNKGKKNGGR